MKKRYLLVLILAIFTAGIVFAQNDDDIDTMPKNTITADIGPALMGMIYRMGSSTVGYGIGVQYEHQMNKYISLGGRFAFLGYSYESLHKESISSFSLESHTRYYPSGRIFFLDGMLGYAGLSVNLKKKYETFSEYRNYIKYGMKIGWRIDTDKPGGFIFEPSLGYFGGIGLGDTFMRRMEKTIWYDEYRGLLIDELASILFISGPRISLSFGWRF